jgi:2-haloacid dehalogenase
MMAIQGVVFDVFGTLFQIAPLGERLADAGLGSGLLGLWFARVLRDGFALQAAGTYQEFDEVAASALETLLAESGKEPDRKKVEHVLAGFTELPPWPDTEPALRLLYEERVPTMTLGNGSGETARKLLHKAGLDALVRNCLSIDDVRSWKPSAAPYALAVRALGVPASGVALIAAHSWDILGAHHAGLRTAWVSRVEKRFPSALGKPDIAADTLDGCVARLLG